MYDPYSWYWMTTYSSRADARGATAHADALFLVVVPAAMVVVCIALATWVHLVVREPKVRSMAPKLDRPERRRLAQMERRLRAADPALARMLSEMQLPAPARPTVTSPRREEPDR
jgi:hypothetical protein